MKMIISSILILFGIAMMAFLAAIVMENALKTQIQLGETFVYVLLGLTMFLTGGIIAINDKQ